MPEVYENQNWVVNAVESEDVYRQMQAAGQVNSNELYLVQDDSYTYEKYDAVFTYEPSSSSANDTILKIKGDYNDLVSKYESGIIPTFLVIYITWYWDIEMRDTYSGLMSMYLYSDRSIPVCSFITPGNRAYKIGIGYDNSYGTEPIYYAYNGKWS